MPRLFFNPTFSPIKEEPGEGRLHAPANLGQHIWTPCKKTPSKDQLYDDPMAPRTPAAMPCQPTLHKHLADLQQTRAEIQAGANHLFDVYGEAKQELHKYKDCEHHAKARELAAVRDVESAIKMRAAILHEIRRHTRALQAAEKLLQDHEKQLQEAALVAATAQLQRDRLRHQTKLASVKAKECSKSARHMANALEGAQRAEEELAAAFPLKTSPISPAKVRHVENVWGDLWDP